MAAVVTKIKALDLDIGPNAEMDYRIVDGDGLGTFRIVTDRDTQEGLITLQKVLSRASSNVLSKEYTAFLLCDIIVISHIP